MGFSVLLFSCGFGLVSSIRFSVSLNLASSSLGAFAMGEENIFLKLPPNIRAFALVRHYLSSFALMESGVNGAIKAALKLDAGQGFIVCKNLQFRSKMLILRTLVDHLPMGEDERKSFDKLIVRLTVQSDDRNMVAHDVFGPDEHGDGVEFIVTKASGKLRFPDVRWSVALVEEKSNELLEALARLKDLSSAFRRSEVIKAMMDHPNPGAVLWPTDALSGLAGLFAASPRASSDQDLIPQETIDAKSPEAPQELQPRAE